MTHHSLQFRYDFLKASVEDGGEDVVILSTRRDTKKFAMLTANPHVAILVHDFDSRKSELAGATGGKFTITLNGEAQVETTNAEAYRSVHAQNNPGKPTSLGANVPKIHAWVGGCVGRAS